jgi:hypothetical protein
MAIGRRPSITASRGSFLIPGATASAPIREGACVALDAVGLFECGDDADSSSFLGFASTAVGLGDPVFVISVRGSTITPIVEGAAALIPQDPVYISHTAGEVSQTPPSPGVGTVLVQVGVALSSTQMILVTDSRVGMVG